MNTTFDRVKPEDVDTLFGTQTKTGKNEWLTPPEIVKALGPFDLDPCSPIKRPWPTAARHFTIIDNGLLLPWEGRVWCNPPYGTETARWLARCAEHGNAIALTFARTETKMFFESIWNTAAALLFFRGRLKFHHVNGQAGDSAGAPSVLIAYGQGNVDALINSGLDGKVLRL